MNLPSIAQHAAEHSILPLKRYGQNFLFDLSLCEKIVRASKIDVNANVIEIGPGVAGLTRAILGSKPNSLTVIETDKRCISLLEEVRGVYPNLHVIHGDALRFEISVLIKTLNIHSVDIVSNLPYQIGTVLLIKWLKDIACINSITVMLQKEVVDRICAVPRTKAYGRLSILCQLICDVEKCFNVSPKAFYPSPNVISSVVRLSPLLTRIDPVLLNKVEYITQIAFRERRKMLRSALKSLTPNIEELLLSLNIDPSNRAEELEPKDYLTLAQASHLI